MALCLWLHNIHLHNAEKSLVSSSTRSKLKTYFTRATLSKNRNASCNNFKDFTELQFIIRKSVNWNKLGPNLWISHDWENRSVGHRYLKGRGIDKIKWQYLVWPPFASCSATHLHHKELISLLIVACGMLSHSSSMAVRSCWILTGTGMSCRTRRSRASQTCSIRDTSGEYAGHGRTGKFSVSRNCVQILATLGRALSCWNMRCWWEMNGMNICLSISVPSKCHQ